MKKLEKIERINPPKKKQTILFEFPSPPRSGEEVVNLRKVNKSFSDKDIYKEFDFMVRRKERWCVMGVNGAGKSTLLKLVAGMIAPDNGSVTIGASVKMGYFAQHAMDILNEDHSVFETLETSFPQASQGALRALAGCFGFSGDDTEKNAVSCLEAKRLG